MKTTNDTAKCDKNLEVSSTFLVIMIVECRILSNIVAIFIFH